MTSVNVMITRYIVGNRATMNPLSRKIAFALVACLLDGVAAWVAPTPLDAASPRRPAATTTKLGVASLMNADASHHRHRHREEEGSKSIADYTLGLHGGKYQFGEAAAFSAVGQEFAASLYSSGDDETSSQPVDYAAEEIPAWAVRMSELTAKCLTMYGATIQELPHNRKVTITNDEMTWEKFYGFIVPRQEPQEASVVAGNDEASSSGATTTAAEATTATSAVQPWVGMLSPRGGQATLRVSVVPVTLEPSWLVVGTETERWIYLLPSVPDGDADIGVSYQSDRQYI